MDTIDRNLANLTKSPILDFAPCWVIFQGRTLGIKVITGKYENEYNNVLITIGHLGLFETFWI